MADVLATNPHIVHQGLRNQWKELIIKQLIHIRAYRPCLNFIVDALEACGSNDDTKLLIQLFVELKNIPNVDIGVFLTSRPEVVIRLGCKRLPEAIHQNLDLRSIVGTIVKGDILAFIRHELEQIFADREVESGPSEENLQILAERAGTLFIYAATAYRFISEPGWDPAERLTEIIKNDFDMDSGQTAQLDDM